MGDVNMTEQEVYKALADLELNKAMGVKGLKDVHFLYMEHYIICSTSVCSSVYPLSGRHIKSPLYVSLMVEQSYVATDQFLFNVLLVKF